MKTKQNMVECTVGGGGGGRMTGGTEGERLYGENSVVNTQKNFNPNRCRNFSQKVRANQSAEVCVCWCIYVSVYVCVCVFASVLGVCQCIFAKKKVRSARGHQLASALTWSKTTETRANGCHHQHCCCYCCCCNCSFYCCCHCNVFFRRLAWLQPRRAIGPTRPASCPFLWYWNNQ